MQDLDIKILNTCLVHFYLCVSLYISILQYTSPIKDYSFYIYVWFNVNTSAK